MVLFQRMALRLPGEVSWESSPPWSGISHAVAASVVGGVSFSRQGKPEPHCKPISISLSAPLSVPEGVVAPHPGRAPPAPPESGSREVVSGAQLSSGAALSLVWVLLCYKHPWDRGGGIGCPHSHSEKGLASTAAPGSREIRNKPKPSRKRGLCFCASRKELSSLGRLSSWLIATGQIFNYLTIVRSSAEGSLQKAGAFPPKSVFSLFKKEEIGQLSYLPRSEAQFVFWNPGKVNAPELHP